MTSVKLLLNKSRILRDGSYPLVFQLIHRRQKKLIYTPYRLYPEEFDSQSGTVCYVSNKVRCKEEVRRANQAISHQLHTIDKHIRSLEQSGSCYSVSDILMRYRAGHDKMPLLFYMDKQVARKHALGKFGTEVAYRNTRSSVAAFIGKRNVCLDDIDASFVRDYEEFLLQRGVSHNTVCYYIRNLRAIYNQALFDGYQENENCPFRHVRSNPCKTVKRALRRDVLCRMQEMDLSSTPCAEIARDLFLFSFFSRGMSFVDIIYLKKSNIDNGMIGYNRHKTGQWLQISVTPQLADLIRKYDNSSEYVFPLLKGGSAEDLHRQYRLALERVNRNLKRVGILCGIAVPLTMYMARHSWATQARETGAPIAVISEGLGHTSEKTTQIYLKAFDQCVVDRVNEQVSMLICKKKLIIPAGTDVESFV